MTVRRTGHEACGRKRHYWNETDARIAAVKHERKAGVPLYTYRCKACDGFHITKQPQQQPTEHKA